MPTITVNLIKPELDRLPAKHLYIAEQGWGNLRGTHGNFSYDNNDPGYVHLQSGIRPEQMAESAVVSLL